MLKSLKIVGFLEGVSLLLLFGVAMPLKYMFDKPWAVEVVGMAHGVLFVAYIVAVLVVGLKYKWKISTIIFSFLASVVPFGTFYADKKWFHISDEGRA